MMKNLLGGMAMLCLLGVAACKDEVASIKPADIPLDQYASATCSRADTLMHTARVNLKSLSTRYNKSRKGTIATLKGQIIALEHRLKRC